MTGYQCVAMSEMFCWRFISTRSGNLSLANNGRKNWHGSVENIYPIALGIKSFLLYKILTFQIIFYTFENHLVGGPHIKGNCFEEKTITLLWIFEFPNFLSNFVYISESELNSKNSSKNIFCWLRSVKSRDRFWTNHVG